MPLPYTHLPLRRSFLPMSVCPSDIAQLFAQLGSSSSCISAEPPRQVLKGLQGHQSPSRATTCSCGRCQLLQGLRAALQEALRIKGLLEMAHEVLSDWVSRCTSCVEAVHFHCGSPEAVGWDCLALNPHCLRECLTLTLNPNCLRCIVADGIPIGASDRLQVDAFIHDIESLDDDAAPAPLPRTASGTPTIPPPSEAAAFRASLF